MQETTNYKFPKPEDDDFFNVVDFANMMDAVDTQLKKHDDKMDNLDVTELKNKVAELTTDISTKSRKYKQTSATLLAASWRGGTSEILKNTITVQGVTEKNDVQVIPEQNWTVAQAEAWTDAMILCAGQSKDTLIIKAYGYMPTVDIPITVLIGDEVEVE